MRMWFSVAFLQIVLLAASCAQQCPDDQLPSSCECLQPYAQIFLKCKQVTEAELEKSLVAMKGYNITELHIENSTLHKIPSKRLRDIHVSKIHVLDSVLFYLFDMPLSGTIASSLDSLKLNNVDFELGLDWNLFEEADSLKEVFLTKTPVYRISQPLTDVGESVETFELSDGELDYVHKKAFSDFHKLRYLLLKNNRLQVFSRLMLPFPTSNLQLLDLSNNQLSSFPMNSFEGMPKLNSLMLHGNKFQVIQEVHLEKVWNQLFFFNLEDNPLDCCQMSWIGKKEKPVHFYGKCVERGTASVKELIELEENYNANC